MHGFPQLAQPCVKLVVLSRFIPGLPAWDKDKSGTVDSRKFWGFPKVILCLTDRSFFPKLWKINHKYGFIQTQAMLTFQVPNMGTTGRTA